ncbi:MAG: hypothetical protein ACREJO_16910 [Phycisphaerales bacterium]
MPSAVQTFLFAAALAWGSSVEATIITLNAGASSGVGMTPTTGTGTSADPFVLTVTLAGDSPVAVISIDSRTDDPAGLGYDWSAYFRVIVTNISANTWSYMNNDLQVVLGIDSTEGDGLSFAQGNNAVRPFTCDLLPIVLETTDVRDWINFREGSVMPGQTMTMNFVISDNSSNRERTDYLVLTPNLVPAAGTALPAALAVLAVARRRRAV